MAETQIREPVFAFSYLFYGSSHCTNCLIHPVRYCALFAMPFTTLTRSSLTVSMGRNERYVVGGFASIVLSVLTIVKGLVDVISERLFSGRVDQAAEAGFAVTAATAGVYHQGLNARAPRHKT